MSKILIALNDTERNSSESKSNRVLPKDVSVPNVYIGKYLQILGRIIVAKNTTLDKVLDTTNPRVINVFNNLLVQEGIPKDKVDEVVKAGKILLDDYRYSFL